MPRYTYRYYVSAYSSEHLDRAKGLVKLSAASSERRDVRSLSGAALLFAIAHLSHAVATLLVDALCSEEGDRRRSTSDAQREIAGLGLPSRLDMLPKKHGLMLQRGWPRPRRLLAAVRLRNRLAHPDGVVLAGSADDLDGLTDDMARRSRSSKTVKQRVRTEDGDIVFAIPLPVGSWGDVKDSTGLEAIEDVQAYLDDVNRLSQASGGTSEFFSVTGTVLH